MLTAIEPTLENCKQIKEEALADTEEDEVGNNTAQRLRGFEEPAVYETCSDTASEEEEVVPSKSEVKPVRNDAPGLAGLDRAAMERERLARAKKAGIQVNIPEPPAKRQKTNHDNHFSGIQSNSGLQYPNGTIKWTYAEGYPRESHVITIEEVLQKDTLKAAVLSAFQVLSVPPLLTQLDFPWILTKLDLSKTTVVFIGHSDSEEVPLPRYMLK